MSSRFFKYRNAEISSTDIKETHMAKSGNWAYGNPNYAPREKSTAGETEIGSVLFPGKFGFRSNWIK